MAKYILIEVLPECEQNLGPDVPISISAQFFAPGPIMAKAVSLAEDDGFGHIIITDTTDLEKEGA